MNYQEIFTPEEWTHLKEVMSSIHHFIPDNHMGLVWNSYQRIAKVNTSQPCGCASAAKYWVEAVNTINNFIKEQGV
jgi:hypothetical protein